MNALIRFSVSQSSLVFDGSGYVSFPSSIYPRRGINSINVFFRTLQRNTLLFLLGYLQKVIENLQCFFSDPVHSSLVSLNFSHAFDKSTFVSFLCLNKSSLAKLCCYNIATVIIYCDDLYFDQ